MFTLSSSCLFVAPVENVFKIGSVKPGAMLFDAAKEFEVKSDQIIWQHVWDCIVPSSNQYPLFTIH